MRFIYLFIIVLFINNCSIKYIKQPLGTPPKQFIPNKITTSKEWLTEYQRALITIKEWQSWYNIQVETNYFQ